MSRFAEGDGWESEEDEQAFYAELDAAYTQASNDLRGFLAYLDAMPRKRIIAARFMAPGSGDMCAVASFCAYKGVPREKMLEAERDSRLQRLDLGYEETGDSGPTVTMGEAAGLPHLVAYNMAWHNDMVWDVVEDGYTEIPGVKGRYEGHRLVPDDTDAATHWIQHPYRQQKYREMTPEERWRKLRDHIAAQIGDQHTEASA